MNAWVQQGRVFVWRYPEGPGSFWWYAIAHVVPAIPEVWAGAKIHELRSAKRGLARG